MFQLILAIEGDIKIAMNAQFHLIAMKRLYDYSCLPQEAAHEVDTDARYQSYTVYTPRDRLGQLECQNTDAGIVIVRKRSGGGQVVLVQAREKNTFCAPQGGRLTALDPKSEAL